MTASADGVVERAEQRGRELDPGPAGTRRPSVTDACIWAHAVASGASTTAQDVAYFMPVLADELTRSHQAEQRLTTAVDRAVRRSVVLSRLLRGMARRVGEWRETAAVLGDPDAVSAIREGEADVTAGRVLTLDEFKRAVAAHRTAPRPAVRTGSFAVPGGPKTLADEDAS